MTQIDGVQAACSGSVFVSIPKSGTHLTLKLYGRAGYLQTGWGRIEPSDRGMPREDQKRDLLRNHPPFAAIVQKFPYLAPDVIFSLLEHLASTEIGDARTAMSLNDDFLEPGVQAAWREVRRLRNENLFAPRMVVSTHVLPWTAASNRFVWSWGRTSVPAIVYGYRDPRAQIISMIEFLSRSDYVTTIPMVQIYRPILQGLGSMDRMLSFAISDPAFPFRDAYRQNRWMLHHPGVLKLRFEDVVGEEGGGCRMRQQAAIESWANFLAVDVPVEKLSEGLFGNTKTFNKGRVDAWRDVFKEHHLRAFEHEFGDVLADYGYSGN